VPPQSTMLLKIITMCLNPEFTAMQGQKFHYSKKNVILLIFKFIAKIVSLL
jgi:hypothetical protein